MNKPARILVSTLAAATLVGSASAAASACDRPGGSGDGTRAFSQTAHHHRHLSFAQRQAAILAQLQRADDKLSTYIAQLRPAAQADPSSWQAQAVTRLQQKQAKLESLISAVRNATTDRQIDDAFRAAFGSSPFGSHWAHA